MGEVRNTYNILDGKTEGKRPLGRPREDDIRMNLVELAWENVDWIHLARGWHQ
jgi:hypothetical protein